MATKPRPLQIILIGCFIAAIGCIIFELIYGVKFTGYLEEQLALEDSMEQPRNPAKNNLLLPGLGDYKIVGFVTNNFRSVAVKWFERLEDLGYKEHVIISYDNETSQYLEDLNSKQTPGTKNHKYHYRFENYFLPPLPPETRNMKYGVKTRKKAEMAFSMRWHYILSQLKSGTSILLTDVDNIFNKHLNLDQNPDFYTFDVIHAYSNIMPVYVLEQMGFTVCGGMSWLRATPPTIDFIQRLVDKCGTICDDQIVLNEMILNEMAIEWDEDTTNVTSNTQSRTGRSNTTGHAVKVWDHDLAYRGPSLIVDGCPLDNIETNWIAMPFGDPSLTRFKITRVSVIQVKLQMFDAWDKMCGINITRNVVSN